jgi:hypothetical protein
VRKGDGEQRGRDETAKAGPRSGKVQRQSSHRRHERDERQRLDGEGEVDSDTGAEQHRQPQEPALLLGLQQARNRRKKPGCHRARRRAAAGTERPSPGPAADLRHAARPPSGDGRHGTAAV